MQHRHFTVIGLSDSHHQWLAPQVQERIARGHIFSGGQRHHTLVAPLLPPGAEWIDIEAPLERTFEAYTPHDDITVFASGDPLFYGFAATLQRRYPDARIDVFPTFNSLQTLAHRTALPYHDMRCISLCGRPWTAFDSALIGGAPLVGLLTDRRKTPQAIAQRMVRYGYTHYSVTLGEQLGNETEERISTLSVGELATLDRPCRTPNCLILRRADTQPAFPFGLPETQFELLDGRANMITKAPVRLATLAALGLPRRRCLWDIGACTGSVSIEARRMAPDMLVESFEIRPACRDIIGTNARRFGTPGISLHMGDFLLQPLDTLPRPDAVFIGGHGGRLADIIGRVVPLLQPGGCVVLNAVSPASVSLFEEACRLHRLDITLRQRIAVDTHNPILILRAEPAADHS